MALFHPDRPAAFQQVRSAGAEDLQGIAIIPRDRTLNALLYVDGEEQRMSFLADLQVFRPIRLRPRSHHVLDDIHSPDFDRRSLVAAFLAVRMHADIELTVGRAIREIAIAAGPPIRGLLLGAD